MRPTVPQVPRCESAEWLPLEASGRRYARLKRPEGVDAETAIFMQFPRGARPAEVERVARSTLLLGQAGLPVPEVYSVEAEHLWLLQEDLGDLSLAAAREAGNQVAPAYSEAVALLQRIEGLELSTSPRPPLDSKRLGTELHQFATIALKLSEGPGASLKTDFDSIIAACGEQPTVLCHRDYHSRNLMLHEGRVRVIDHQDALPGPASYDRVSLAYDPYVELPDDIRDRIAGEQPGVSAVAIQRLAKAIGTFADKGGQWARFIRPAAQQARRLIARDGLAVPVLDLAFATLAAQSAAALEDTASQHSGGTGASEAAAPTRRAATGEAGEAS